MSDATPTARIDPVTVANAATDVRTAPVSPTGKAMIPSGLAPWLMLAATIGGIPAALLATGVAVPAVVVTIGSILASIAVILLGGSPGLRKT